MEKNEADPSRGSNLGEMGQGAIRAVSGALKEHAPDALKIALGAGAGFLVLKGGQRVRRILQRYANLVVSFENEYNRLASGALEQGSIDDFQMVISTGVPRLDKCLAFVHSSKRGKGYLDSGLGPYQTISASFRPTNDGYRLYVRSITTNSSLWNGSPEYFDIVGENRLLDGPKYIS